MQFVVVGVAKSGLAKILNCSFRQSFLISSLRPCCKVQSSFVVRLNLELLIAFLSNIIVELSISFFVFSFSLYVLFLLGKRNIAMGMEKQSITTAGRVLNDNEKGTSLNTYVLLRKWRPSRLVV